MLSQTSNKLLSCREPCSARMGQRHGSRCADMASALWCLKCGSAPCRSSHPQGLGQLVDYEEVPTVSEDALTNLQTVVQRLKPSKALDPGGWSHELLQQVTTIPAVMKHLSEWLPMLYARPVPSAWDKFFYGFRPVFLVKDPAQPHESRPILISMLFRKLWAAMLAQQLLPELLPICEGTQFGTSVANGSATMVASMASALLEDEELCFLQLDVHNAFSALDRAVLLRTLEEHGGDGYQKHKQAVRALVRAPICVLAPCQLAGLSLQGCFDHLKAFLKETLAPAYCSAPSWRLR